MTARLILKYPNSRLRDKSEEVEISEWENVTQWCQDLRDTMIANVGTSLAAPQVGIKKRIYAISAKELSLPETFGQEQQGEILFFINPVLKLVENVRVKITESCLSVPDSTYAVKRSPVIDLTYTTPSQELKSARVIGKDAIVIQHEQDHLDGVLFIDRLDIFDSRKFHKRFEKPKRQPTEGEINQLREQKRAKARKNRKK